VLTLQVRYEIVDVSGYDRDFRSGFLCKSFRDLINPFTVEEPCPDISAHGIHAEKLIPVDVEDDRAIMIND
jgi:hypothetical protein